MTVLPDCYRCIYFNEKEKNCKIYDIIPKEIIEGKKVCKEKNS